MEQVHLKLKQNPSEFLIQLCSKAENESLLESFLRE